jgi:hypothetical protein
MSRFDRSSPDAAVLAELDVIDRTLAGEPVDPGQAELAELALLLSSDREQPAAEFSRSLDARVARRFSPASASGPMPGTRSRLRRRLASPRVIALGLVGVLIAVAVAIGGFGSLAGRRGSTANVSAGPAAGVQAERSPARGASSSAGTAGNGTSKAAAGARSSSSGAAKALAGSLYSGSGAASTAASTTSSATGLPAPVTTGRKVVQSAQLTLQAANDRTDTVSQEIYNVVAAENGIVKSAKITDATASQGGGSAVFTLSIPSANLETTLEQMSKLHFARVLTRSNSTSDVTNTYDSDRSALQDEQALRLSLLKQLGEATTTAEIDSLQARLKLAEAQIQSDQSTLANLKHSISYSNLSVQLYSGSAAVSVISHSHGFTLAGAWHDALRVLVVAVGVLVIAAAVLIPVTLLAALLGWLAHGVRKLRREHELERS